MASTRPAHGHRHRQPRWEALFTDGAFLESKEFLAGSGRFAKKLQTYLRPAVLVVDEVGYLPLGREEANMVFQLVSRRYERGSIILTSNHLSLRTRRGGSLAVLEWVDWHNHPRVGDHCVEVHSVHREEVGVRPEGAES